MTETAVIWSGAEELRQFLVPIADLEPFPGNPRRGDVEQLRGSLKRFGQVLPALADPDLGRRRSPSHRRRLSDDDGPSQITPTGQREHRDPAMKELVLLYSAPQLEQVDIWAGIVAKEKGTKGISETIYAALETAARTLNG